MEDSEIKTRVQALISEDRHIDALQLLESSLQAAVPDSASHDLCDLCNTVGMAFLKKGDMATSLDLLKRAENLAERQSEMRAAVLNNLACYYRKLKKAKTALTYLEKALEIETKFPSAKSLANTHLNYCAILSEIGKHDEALTHIMKAVILLQDELLSTALQHEPPPPDKTEVLAIAYHNLAVEVEFQKEYAEALSLYRKAADFATEFLPEGHKVRADLTRIFVELEPQLSEYVTAGEKKKKQKMKGSGSASYLAEIRKKASVPMALNGNKSGKTLNPRTPVQEFAEEEEEKQKEETETRPHIDPSEVPLDP